MRRIARGPIATADLWGPVVVPVVATLAQRVYPHCLRATAASAHAYRGLTVPALQAMMGWAQIDTAEKYIRLSGGRTKAALDEVYG